MPAVSAKGGLMMGTKKVGTLPSRLKRAINIIAPFSRFLRRPGLLWPPGKLYLKRQAASDIKFIKTTIENFKRFDIN